MTSRYRGENAVPFSLRGVGIAPTIELAVVIGMGIPCCPSPVFTVLDKRIALKGLPYLVLPDEINLSNPSMATYYEGVQFTNNKRQTFDGKPISFSSAML